jgi:hypothetical protein
MDNWVIGGSATDSTGAVIGGATPTGPSTWTMSPGQPLASGSPISYQAVAIVAAPNTSTPTIGKVQVDAIQGHLCLTPNTAFTVGRVTVAVCIYVSEFNSSTSKWDVRDPINTADAARDDYFFWRLVSLTHLLSPL